MRSGARLARVLFGAFFALIYVVVFAFGYAEHGHGEPAHVDVHGALPLELVEQGRVGTLEIGHRILPLL